MGALAVARDRPHRRDRRGGARANARNARRSAEERGRRSREYRPGDLVGKVGVERVYEDWLAGKPGVRRIAVDVRGNPVEEIARRAAAARVGRDPDDRRRRPEGGRGRARERHQARARLHRPGRRARSSRRRPAPSSRSIRAAARSSRSRRNPDFDPNLFVGSTPRGELAKLNAPGRAHAVPQPRDRRGGAAGLDVQAADGGRGVGRAARSARPHVLRARATSRSGTACSATGRRTVTARVGLSRSLAESCDIVYYTLGIEMDAQKRKLGEHLQEVARNFGFGQPTEHRPARRAPRASSPTRSGSGTASRTRRPTTGGGSRATRRTSRSARASCRRRRCSSRARTPRSRTAGRCTGRTS